mgnify:CR=1 FL=1
MIMQPYPNCLTLLLKGSYHITSICLHISWENQSKCIDPGKPLANMYKPLLALKIIKVMKI